MGEAIGSVMPCEAQFHTLGCTSCLQVFELPCLSESTYGEILLTGDRGTVHRYVCVSNHPAWRVIEEVLPSTSLRMWHVLAALADPVNGQRLRVEPVCPHCQADGTHFRTPRWASRTPSIAEVEDATFDGFLATSPAEQRARVEAAASEA